MKSARQILDHLNKQIKDIDAERDRGVRAMSDIRWALLSEQRGFAQDLKRWIEAPVPFDPDLMGSSDDKEAM